MQHAEYRTGKADLGSWYVTFTVSCHAKLTLSLGQQVRWRSKDADLNFSGDFAKRNYTL